MPLAPVRLTIDSTIVFCSGAALAQLAHLAEREIDRPGRREEAARRLGALLGRVVVEHRRELLKARQIGFGIGRIVDRVRRVEEVGHREIGAALLVIG